MADARIAYGARCMWWDSIAKVGTFSPKQKPGDPPVTLPCCPHCKGTLFEWPDEAVALDGARKYEAQGHEGYFAFFEWLRGKCFPGLDMARMAYEEETGKTFTA